MTAWELFDRKVFFSPHAAKTVFGSVNATGEHKKRVTQKKVQISGIYNKFPYLFYSYSKEKNMQIYFHV